MTTFTPSSQQLAIRDALLGTTNNLSVSAVAGSGKTTTLVWLLEQLPQTHENPFLPYSIIFLAFNKNIAETLKPRCPRHVQCSTFHSLGLRALKDSGTVKANVQISGLKVPKLVWNALGKDHEDAQSVIKLVSLAKSRAGDSPHVDFKAIADQYDIDIGYDKSFDVATKVLAYSTADLSTIDFDDMLYLPAVLGCQFPSYDYVFVDEAQDTNDVQREILWRLQKPPKLPTWCLNAPLDKLPEKCPWEPSPTHTVIVGDPRQSIYGFRGANSDAMTRLQERFTMKSLPLSVSYRCPRNIVLEAQTRGSCTFIQPWLDAKDGEVRERENYNTSDFPPNSIVLCRANAPLVKLCYGMLKRGLRATIRGRDIGAELVAVVKRLKAVDLEDLDQKLTQWRVTEGIKCDETGRSPERIYDQHACLKVFLERAKEPPGGTITRLITMIESAFTDANDDSTGCVVLSSVHKAKGLEFPVVFILDRDKYMPSRYATQGWQKEQEKNLLYVAITRSQDKLYYIQSDKWQNTNTNKPNLT